MCLDIRGHLGLQILEEGGGVEARDGERLVVVPRVFAPAFVTSSCYMFIITTVATIPLIFRNRRRVLQPLHPERGPLERVRVLVQVLQVGHGELVQGEAVAPVALDDAVDDLALAAAAAGVLALHRRVDVLQLCE